MTGLPTASNNQRASSKIPLLKKEAANGREMVLNSLVVAKTFSMELWPRCLGTVTGTDWVITSDHL